MYLIAIAWMYVVLMMALAEALSAQGTILGALVTFLLYGCLPLSILMYLLGTPMRRRARLAAEAEQAQLAPSEKVAPSAAVTSAGGAAPPLTPPESAPHKAPEEASAAQPDGGGLPPRDAVAAKGEER
jgi:hypothetical protein